MGSLPPLGSRRGLVIVAVAALGAGCFGRTPTLGLVCPEGEPLAGGRCTGGPGEDGGLDDQGVEPGSDVGLLDQGFDAGATDLDPFDFGPADLPDSGLPDSGGSIPVEVSPAALDFGTLRLTAQRVLPLVIENPGPGSRFVSLEVGAQLTVDRASVQLAPGERATVQVVFRSEALGRLSSEFVLRSCGGACPVTVPATALVILPAVTCAPVDAGAIPAGACVEAVSTCVNRTDQEGVFLPGLVFGPLAGRVLSDARTVAARSSFDVRLELCAPRVADFTGRFEARVNFPVNAVDELSVPVQAEGVDAMPPACASTVSSRVDFGRVPVNGVGQGQVTVENTGGAVCNLSMPQIIGSGAAAFRVASMLPSVPPGVSRTIDLELRPTAVGPLRARFEFSLDDPNRAQAQVQLEGEGISAQPNARYTISQSSISGVSIGAGRALRFTDNDDGYAVEQLPFAFDFLGRAVTQVFIGTNGFIGFNQAGAGSLTNRAIPASNNPNGLIAWFWDDLTLDLPTSRVSVRLGGLAPNRRFVLSFQDIRRFGGGGVAGADTRLEAQIILYEGSSAIEVRYGRARSTTAAGFDASIGWENDSGQAGGSPVMCSPTCRITDWPTNTAITYTPSP